jgi:energy-coupling factor transporter ATP-binding protein EcfA2
MPEPSLSYNPISKVMLPGAGPIALEGLILIVGPNSSGKTQFLNDIRAAITGAERELVVCDKIELKRPDDLEGFLAGLVKSGCINRDSHSSRQEQISIQSPVLGSDDKHKRSRISTGQAVSWHQGFDQPNHQAEFLKFFGNLLVTTLSLSNRLTTTDASPVFDHEKQAPTSDLQALHLNWNGQDQLNIEIKRAFGKAIAIDSTTTKLRLKVFDKPAREPPRCRAGDQDSLPIEQEGDGLRSFAAICVTLLAGHRPVCLIDEPESCLHPPQERALGQFIGRHGSDSSRTTLVATHSSHILRGIVESASEVQILRLSRQQRKFSAHRIDYQILMDSINKPIVRTETVLDGVFADGVILVESDGDRAVYEAAFEAAKSEVRFDALFIPAGGHSGIPSLATFYKRLKIPAAAIADLDFVSQPSSLRNALSALSARAPVPASGAAPLHRRRESLRLRSLSTNSAWTLRRRARYW